MVTNSFLKKIKQFINRPDVVKAQCPEEIGDDHLSVEEIKKAIASVPWHHRWEIYPGIYTEGSYDPSYLWERLKLHSNLHGKSIADIGASNGFFSFEARKRGADVTAFDFRHENASGFALAKKINGMHIPHKQVNVLDLSKEEYGMFDIVFFLGVIYHISDPLLALKNVLNLTKEKIFVESYCIDNNIPLLSGRQQKLSAVSEELGKLPLVLYLPDNRRHPQYNPTGDYSNFWGFTSFSLRMMIEDFGFKIHRCEVHADRVLIEASPNVKDKFFQSRLNVAYGVVGDSSSGKVI